MSCKYDIIDEGGRKRVRALRPFTVQGRDVCPMELGGYVYDDKTLSQEGNCWIFSGSLEYPGVRVLDEAIVDMGISLPKTHARPERVIISGNSRIMGAISFETQSFDVVQTPAMWEQGGYTANVGMTPVKASDGSRIRIAAALFGGSVGKVAVTSASYEARIISLDSDGLVMDGGTWTAGGPAVTLTTTSPNFLVEVRKTPSAAITPADVTAAGITVTRAREATLRIFNSSIVPVYNGVVTLATSILRYEVTDPRGIPYQVNIQNSYLRIECVFNVTNIVRANADFTRVNYNLALTSNVSHYITGTYRNTNINSPASVGVAGFTKNNFDVSDCPDFEYSTVTFPDLAAMITSGKTFYFKNCNMPAGSAIHYYDPKVNVWDNIDFTKAMADLGKALPAQATLTMVSSNKQGWYRVYGINSKSHGALVESLSSISSASFATAKNTYDTIIHKDHTITGAFEIIGRNVFGGTLGGASKITNTAETAMVIDGNFRIEGNAQVTDTPLKGTGYIGGNAELKNGNVQGYIYMDGNAKYIPAAVANPPIIVRLIMRDNSKVTLQYNLAGQYLKLEAYDNAIVSGAIRVQEGSIILRGDAKVVSSNTPCINARGNLVMKDSAAIVSGIITTFGDVNLIGNFRGAGSYNVAGNLILSDVSQIGETELPPTKITW